VRTPRVGPYRRARSMQVSQAREGNPTQPRHHDAIALEITPYMIRIRRGEPLQKHLLKERVLQFGAIEVSEPHGNAASHARVNAHGVRVRDVA